MMQPFGVPFSQHRHSVGSGVPVNPPAPVRMVTTPRGAPAPSTNVGAPRAKMDRNNSLNNLQAAVSSTGIRKSMSTDRLDLLQGKASSSPRVQGTSPGPKQAAVTKQGTFNSRPASKDAPKTEIRTPSTNVDNSRTNTPGSKQTDQGNQRSMVVSRTPPRQPQAAPRRSSLSSQNTTPRAPIAPEDIGHFVGTVGDSIDRSAQYPRGRYCIIRKLGAGVYGKVLEVEDRKYNARVAIKIIRREPPVYREAVKKEIKVLLELDGMYGTLKMLRTFEHQGHVCLSLELLGIPLSDRIRDTGGLPLDDIRDIGLQLFHAMEYVHKRGIIHTDIKPDNILVARDKNADGTSAIRVKMVDFGSAISRGEWHPPLIGTLEYRAPESVLQASYNQLVDVWAIGCVLVELLTSKVLFRGASRQDTEGHLLLLMEQALQQRLPEALIRKGAANRNAHNAPFMSRNSRGQPAIARILKKGALPYQTVRSIVKDRELLDLTLKTLCMEPERRLTSSEAKLHPFFKNSLLDASSVDEYGHLKSHARRAAAMAKDKEDAANKQREASSAEAKAEEVPRTPVVAACPAPSTPLVRSAPAPIVPETRAAAPPPPPPPTPAKESEAEIKGQQPGLATAMAEPEAAPAQEADTPETVTSRVESPETGETRSTPTPEAAPRRLLPAESAESELNTTVELSAEELQAATRPGQAGEALSSDNLLDITQHSQGHEASSLHASSSTISVENVPYEDLKGALDSSTNTPRSMLTPRSTEDRTSPIACSPERAAASATKVEVGEEGRKHTVEVYSRRLSGVSTATSGAAAPPQMPPSPTQQWAGGGGEEEGAKGDGEEEVMSRAAMARLLASSAAAVQGSPPRRMSPEDASGARTVRISSQDYNATLASNQAPQASLPALGASIDAPRPPMGESMDGYSKRYSAVPPSQPTWTPPSQHSATNARPPQQQPQQQASFTRPSSGSGGQQGREAGSSALQQRPSLLDYHSKRIDDLDMRLRDNAKRSSPRNSTTITSSSSSNSNSSSSSSGAPQPAAPGSSGGRLSLSGHMLPPAEGPLRENINANGQPASPSKIQPSSPKVEAPQQYTDSPASPLRTQLRQGTRKSGEGSSLMEEALRQAVSRAGGGSGGEGAGASMVESEVESKLKSLRQFINEAMQEGLYREGEAAAVVSKVVAMQQQQQQQQQQQPQDEVGSSQESAVSTVWLGDEERKVDADGRVLGMDEANAYLL